MTELEARQVLLLRAWEDPPQPPWSADEAERLSERTRADLGTDAARDRWQQRRAALGLASLSARVPGWQDGWQALLTRAPLPRGLVPLWLALALVAGATADAIGRDQTLNLLAPPLLGLLAWQAGVYLLLAVQRLRRARARPAPESAAAGRRGPSTLARLLTRAWTATARRRLRDATATAGDAQAAAVAARVLPAFAAGWARAAQPWLTARSAALLHAGALVFALGLLGSMYARGLTTEYRARWSSTFLDTPAVTTLLRTLHAPAATLLRWPLPDEASVAALRAPALPSASPAASPSTTTSGAAATAGLAPYAGGSAAPWLHLQALTVLLFVGLPRAALAWGASRRAARLARDWPLPWHEPYFERMARAASGHALVVRVLPYSYTQGAGAGPALRAVLRPVLGDALVVDLLPSLPLGGEDQLASTLAALREPPAPGRVCALFSASATPERETHGRFLRALAEGLRADPGAGPGREAPLEALVDLAPLRLRLGTAGAARLDERAAAWRELCQAAGVPMRTVDLARPTP